MGANAFAHESGIHQDGMLKSKATYEIITPEEIGLVRMDDAGIVLGAQPCRSCTNWNLGVRDCMLRSQGLTFNLRAQCPGGCAAHESTTVYVHRSLHICRCGPNTLIAARRCPGKHSGRNALRTRLAQLGFELPPEQLDDVFKRFKVRWRSVQLSAWS